MADIFRLKFNVFDSGLDRDSVHPGLRSLAARMPTELTELPLFADPPEPASEHFSDDEETDDTAVIAISYQIRRKRR